MQYHYVIGYDDKGKEWFIDAAVDAYFPDGNVYDPDAEKRNQYGWIVPDHGTPVGDLDWKLFQMVQSVIVAFPIPEEV